MVAQMVGYELVNLPQKGAAAVMQENRAPIFASGNEFFGYEDSSGSLRRRTLTFLYDHKPTERDPQLEDSIRKRRGPLLLKMLHSYHLMLMLFPGMDWQHRLPVAAGADAAKLPIIGAQLEDFHRRAVQMLDPLQAYVTMADVFELGADLLMSEQEFVSEYNAYRKERLNLPVAKWVEGHYQIVFETFDIRRGTADMQDPVSGAIKPTACLFGIGKKEATVAA